MFSTHPERKVCRAQRWPHRNDVPLSVSLARSHLVHRSDLKLMFHTLTLHSTEREVLSSNPASEDLTRGRTRWWGVHSRERLQRLMLLSQE